MTKRIKKPLSIDTCKRCDAAIPANKLTEVNLPWRTKHGCLCCACIAGYHTAVRLRKQLVRRKKENARKASVNVTQ